MQEEVLWALVLGDHPGPVFLDEALHHMHPLQVLVLRDASLLPDFMQLPSTASRHNIISLIRASLVCLPARLWFPTPLFMSLRSSVGGESIEWSLHQRCCHGFKLGPAALCGADLKGLTWLWTSVLPNIQQ